MMDVQRFAAICIVLCIAAASADDAAKSYGTTLGVAQTHATEPANYHFLGWGVGARCYIWKKHPRTFKKYYCKSGLVCCPNKPPPSMKRHAQYGWYTLVSSNPCCPTDIFYSGVSALGCKRMAIASKICGAGTSPKPGNANAIVAAVEFSSGQTTLIPPTKKGGVDASTLRKVTKESEVVDKAYGNDRGWVPVYTVLPGGGRVYHLGYCGANACDIMRTSEYQAVVGDVPYTSPTTIATAEAYLSKRKLPSNLITGRKLSTNTWPPLPEASVFFHIVEAPRPHTKDQSSSYVTEDQIISQVRVMNTAYNPYGISFEYKDSGQRCVLDGCPAEGQPPRCVESNSNWINDGDPSGAVCGCGAKKHCLCHETPWSAKSALRPTLLSRACCRHA
ncbi:hypothetical protein COO60DRAFT_1460947 [Scenedesmus sp. NREL 46B-D3]|nr:hypothetical protein COO60DRAFT_1460947 [Scenedesmus sp. NREL 46B-D3]